MIKGVGDGEGNKVRVRENEIVRGGGGVEKGEGDKGIIIHTQTL